MFFDQNLHFELDFLMRFRQEMQILLASLLVLLPTS